MAESLLSFFEQFFLFCWFQSLIDPFFPLPFFPLSLCASLDMAHRGVLRCVSPFLSFLCCFVLPCWGRMMRYTHVILPCSCPNTVGFADFSYLYFAWLPCTGGSLGNKMSPLYAHTCCLSVSFSCVALCRFATLACHSSSWASNCCFFLSGRMLWLEQSLGGHGTEWCSHCPLSELCCEECLCFHGSHCGLVDSHWPSGIAVVILKILAWWIRVAQPLSSMEAWPFWQDLW